MAPPPTNPVDQPPADLDELRHGFHQLAASKGLDKEAALTLTRLFHGMESLLHHEKHMRVREMNVLRHELERTHMQVELDRLARRRTLDDMQMQQQMAAAAPAQGGSVRRR